MSIFFLKIIAIIFMFIDHFASIFIKELSVPTNFFGLFNTSKYWLLRAFGRISFPLFAFCVGIGLKYTKNLKKYILRLFIFAILTTIPYSMHTSLSNNGKLSFIDFSNLNIMFSFLGSALIVYFYNELFIKESYIKKILFVVLSLIICFLAKHFKTDYNYIGVILPVLIYFSKNKYQSIVFILLSMFVLYGDLDKGTRFVLYFSFIPTIFILFYNGKKGKSMKYLFYFFYPCHLIFLSLLYLFLKVK